MSAGTLTLTNNSTSVSGSGTAFSTELAAGDFIVVTVGGVPYTLPIKAVNSNTSLTLVSIYTGPTQSGAAWFAVPRVALNMVTAALVAQSAEALRGLNYDKQNWQAVFSADGNITVILPDGTSFSGPSWKSIADMLSDLKDGYLKKSNNLSDLDDRAVAWLNVRPQGATPLAADPENPTDATTKRWVENLVKTDGTIVTHIPGQGNSWNDWKTLLATQRTHFLTGDTDSPTGGVVFGFSTGHSNSATGNYGFQFCGRSSSAYLRTAEAGNFQTWLKVTTAAISDITLKDEIEDTDGTLSLENIKAMELKTFVYKDDDKRRVRRGVIAQQIRDIDPCYVKEVHNGDEVNLVLDSNPLLLDVISAVKVLARKVEELQVEIKGLKGE